MCSQRTPISVLIVALFAFAAQSVATADVAMIPNAQASGLSGLDRDAPFRLECAQPIPQQIRENLSPSTRDSRAYLDSARRDPGWNFPSGELKAPNIPALVQIPLGRTVAHRIAPNLDSPVPIDESPQVLDPAGDPLHLRLTHPRPNGLC